MLVRNYSTTHTNTQSKVNLIPNKSAIFNNGNVINDQKNIIKDDKKSNISMKEEKKSNLSLKSHGQLNRKIEPKFTVKRKPLKEKTCGEKEKEIILSDQKYNNILGLVEDKKNQSAINEQKIEIASLKPKSKSKKKVINNQPLMRYMNTTPNPKKNIRKTKSTKNMLRKSQNNKSFVNVNINTNLNISNNYSIYNFDTNNNNNNNQNINQNYNKPKPRTPYVIHTQENKSIKNHHHVKQMSLLNQISKLKLNNKKDDSSKNIKKFNQNNNTKLKKINIYDI